MSIARIAQRPTHPPRDADPHRRRNGSMPGLRTTLTCGLALALSASTSTSAFDHWLEYDEIGPLLQAWEDAYPGICERHDLGLSTLGRHLWAFRITDNITDQEAEPEFKYISTMHGDEIIGTTLTMMLIEEMLTNYGTDEQITRLIDEVDIWFVPLMNPDGYDRSPRRRSNANGVDLNRNFPAFGEEDSTEGREIETALIMDWMAQHSFTLSANFHAGSTVVNYPFDNEDTGSRFTPDDGLFIYVSEEYSRHNDPMWNGAFYHGITNGADWYFIWGGMQDWNYLFRGCNAVTIELSDTKQPPADWIPVYWDFNRDSMLAYMDTVLLGVRGIVSDGASRAPLPATISVVGRDHDIFTDPDVGDYHRMLLPGVYDVRYEADGLDTVVLQGVEVFDGDATIVDVALYAQPQIIAPNGGEELIAGVETTISWTAPAPMPYHVQYTTNADAVEIITDGFESGELGPDYETGGDANWFVTTSDAHSGTHAARAGDVGDDESTWMSRTCSGGSVSFWYRVSSELDWDFFSFFIDGANELHLSGETGWQFYEATLAPGEHELLWVYAKDGSLSGGSDTVWIDDLEIEADTTEWVDVIAETVPGATSAPWTPGEASASCKVRVRALYAATAFGAWDDSDNVFSVIVEPACPADFTGDALVNVFDLLVLLEAWGDCPGCDADLNNDGVVNVFDLLELLEAWGTCE
jgi:hypothetical protein